MTQPIKLNNHFVDGFCGALAVSEHEFKLRSFKSLIKDLFCAIDKVYLSEGENQPFFVLTGLATINLIRYPESSIWVPHVHLFLKSGLTTNKVKKLLAPLFRFNKEFRTKPCFRVQSLACLTGQDLFDMVADCFIDVPDKKFYNNLDQPVDLQNSPFRKFAFTDGEEACLSKFDHAGEGVCDVPFWVPSNTSIKRVKNTLVVLLNGNICNLADSDTALIGEARKGIIYAC